MEKLDPKSVWLFFINSILVWLAVIISFVFAFFAISIETEDTSFPFLNWLWVAIPVSLVLCFVWAKLTHHFYKYELTDMGFRKELGVIYKQYVTIPYDRIQNVDIYRGIWARILGLSDLNIQTAGMSYTKAGMPGGGSEGRLPGISKEVAEQLRDELIRRTRKNTNQGL